MGVQTPNNRKAIAPQHGPFYSIVGDREGGRSTKLCVQKSRSNLPHLRSARPLEALCHFLDDATLAGIRRILDCRVGLGISCVKKVFQNCPAKSFGFGGVFV